jgi:hypothetical protein
MEVAILLKGIVFAGPDSLPDARTAIVAFEIDSDVGTIEFNVEVIPQEEDAPEGVDDAIRIARRSLVEFGKALAEAAEKYEPPTIYSPKGR